MSARSVVRAAFFMSPSLTKEETSDCANGSPAFPFRSGSKEVHVMTKWPLPSRRGFRALVPKWRRVCRRALNDFARETFTGRAEDSASRHNRDGSSDFTHAGAVLRQLEIAKISEPRLLRLPRSESFALSERRTTIGALPVASHFPFASSQAFPATRLALYSGSIAYR